MLYLLLILLAVVLLPTGIGALVGLWLGAVLMGALVGLGVGAALLGVVLWLLNKFLVIA